MNATLTNLTAPGAIDPRPLRYPQMPPDDCRLCGKRLANHRCTWTASYVGWERCWRGVIKNPAGEVVAMVRGTCRNREQSTRTGGTSAVALAQHTLREMQTGHRIVYGTSS